VTHALTGRFDVVVALAALARPHAPSCTLATRAHQGPVQAASLPFHAQHVAVPNAATRSGLHISVHAEAQSVPVAPLAGLCRFGIPSVWQAEEAVANLPLRLAVRVRCGHQACAQHDGVHVGYSSGTRLVLYGFHGVL
jgi:hypothetical protein